MEFIEAFFPYIGWQRCWWFDLLGVLFLFAFWDRERPRSLRNLDLVMMCAWIPLGDYEMGSQRIMTALSYLFLVYFWFRLVWLIVRPPASTPTPTPNLSRRMLTGLSILFLAYNIGLIFTAPFPFGEVGEKGYNISESSLMGVMGAETILSGRPPYGNLEVRGGGAMPYAPAYFLWFVPATAVFGAGHPYQDYAPAARVTTLGLLGLSFWLVRRLGLRLGGKTAEAALGFAWTVLPYTQSASYWSWTGNLLPGVMALIGLNALLSRRALPVAAAVAGAGATAWLPFAWAPLWFFGIDRERRRRYVLAALGISVVLVVLGMLQAHGPARLWEDVSGYLLSAKVPKWRNKWSPFTYHEWARQIRNVALLAVVPTGLWILHRLWRAATVSTWMLAATTALIVVHGQLLMSHAPGRMTLWVLPFYLVVFVVGCDAQAIEKSRRVPAGRRRGVSREASSA